MIESIQSVKVLVHPFVATTPIHSIYLTNTNYCPVFVSIVTLRHTPEGLANPKITIVVGSGNGSIL